MKLTEAQALSLVLLLQSSMEKNIVGYLCFDINTRAKLLGEILSQQDNKTLKEFDEAQT